MQRTDGGKPKMAHRDEDEDNKASVPFDARAEPAALPADGSFQGTGQHSHLPYLHYFFTGCYCPDALFLRLAKWFTAW